MSYTVKSGDALFLIAAQYGISTAELIRLNPQIRNPNLIHPGQTIITPADTTRTPSAQQGAIEANRAAMAELSTSESASGAIAESPGPATIETGIINDDVTGNPRWDVTGSPGNYQFNYLGDNAADGSIMPRGQTGVREEPAAAELPADTTGTTGTTETTETTETTDTTNTTDTTGQLPEQQESPPPPPIRTEFQQNSSKAFMTTILDRYGLGGLAGWAWEKVGEFIPDEEIMLLLRDHPDYKARFPGMEGRFASGLNAISEEQYISLERTYFQIMRASGLPTSFYDGREDFTNFIVNDLSPAELSSRIEDGYNRVTQTDPAVRTAFEEFYGGSADAALAAMFLDPDRAAPMLMKMARTAEVAGIGRRSGVNIGQGQSEEIAAFSPTAAQTNAGFSQVNSQADLEQETFTEFNNLRSGDLISAAFNTSGGVEARQKIRQRRNSRLAAFAGGGGAAFFQGQGFIGTGVADS